MSGTTLGESSVPRLPHGVRLRHDEARGRWVLLAPERLLVPDEISVAILQRCDGEATLGAIVDGLAKDYNAPRETILTDVTKLLQDLADKGMLEG